MLATRTRIVVLIGASLYLAVMAFAGGVAAERIRFDRQRTAVLQRYDAAVQQWHLLLVSGELRAADSPQEVR